MIDQLTAILTDKFGPFGPLMALGGLGVLLIVGALPLLFKREEDPLNKLKKSQKELEEEHMALRRTESGGMGDKLEKYKSFLEPEDSEEYSAIQLRLLQAGYPGKNAVRTYHFAQFALGLGLLFAGLIYSFITNDGETSTQKMIMTVLIPGAVGYVAPKYWVTRRVDSRKEEITNGFPDALDMMLVCVEAGQSLDQAIIRVAKEIRAGYPALADEFEIVSWEIKAGKDRIQVLRDMGERCGVADVQSFVTVLIQSTSFGTSIAEALRVYAGEMRDKRVMRAEEKANTLPTKMTLATMMLTVPPLLIILIGPSVYEVYKTLKNISF
ncbi:MULTISPECIES: type II secretion system F family protein [Maritimibacter]|jgi:tight adherence protein C|uniref:Type II/IV secretion system protein, TadC subfamily protein n=1 Tax=Maritimibacter alkaliphilus HTCC2654 TaxID=314271 RepID=A3VKL8_9RHOB|nr:MULTISPECIES: type II secretion system F family protein [Maritimibacter]EAQ11189.1 type II/IV secretion system protein, TadC subfamily protein [Rhodobacterales bacterium HTCC2654] [Maritimibacter alkaliphilus HTCC2654]MBL6426349.1 type II secretion system F family protein [Maritimibacter sp.]TYP82997.1 tight adherence protein C [Maritimibacter alkaliphilus HTCC2654]